MTKALRSLEKTAEVKSQGKHQLQDWFKIKSESNILSLIELGDFDLQGNGRIRYFEEFDWAPDAEFYEKFQKYLPRGKSLEDD